MKYFLRFSVLLVLLVSISCSNNDDDSSTTIDDDINLFIWQGLNAYYLWQEDVDNLADNKFSSENDIINTFRPLGSPESTFNNLLFEKDSIDRFSWIVDDYEALENSFQGINESNGMEFSLFRNKDGSDNVYGVVRYVIANSSAFTNGVERGMIFNTINNTQININNYNSLLDNSSYTIGLADYNDGNPTSISTFIEISKSQIQENPIAVAKVITEGIKKIGYLLYNQFASNYDGELNATFGEFKSQGVNQLIVDLRYNGGGSVRTATYLGSMMTGQFNNQLYSKERWNNKIAQAFDEENFTNNFVNTISNTDSNGEVILEQNINSLNLTKAYFIVSDRTASASELVINSLSAYIDVELVGTTTIGKQVGSITLYDSDNLFKTGDNLNSDHRYAMQPLVLEIVNKDGKNEIEGYTPGKNINGIFLGEDPSDLGVLGEKSDPLLNTTINLITTGTKVKQNNTFKTSFQKSIYSSQSEKPAKDNMYVELKDNFRF